MTEEKRPYWSFVRRLDRMFCKCGGSGVLVERGEVIPRSRLSPMEQAELMVNGGLAYERVERPCPKHGNDQT